VVVVVSIDGCNRSSGSLINSRISSEGDVEMEILVEV
jgi:hypothetical protein